MVLTIKEIQEIIPHRDPMLLVDEILAMEPGKSAVGRKTFGEEFFAFPGHFPGNPVLPGVLIAEAVAQVGAVCVLSLPEHRGKTAYFGGIDKMRFKRMVLPGDTLKMEIQISKMRGPIGIGKAAAYVGDELACRGEITFAIK